MVFIKVGVGPVRNVEAVPAAKARQVSDQELVQAYLDSPFEQGMRQAAIDNAKLRIK